MQNDLHASSEAIEDFKGRRFDEDFLIKLLNKYGAEYAGSIAKKHKQLKKQIIAPT